MPIDIKNDDLDTAIKKLKARENTLRQLEAVSKLGSWEVDLQTHKSIWSDMSYKIYGISKETPVTLEFFFLYCFQSTGKRLKNYFTIQFKVQKQLVINVKQSTLVEKLYTYLLMHK